MSRQDPAPSELEVERLRSLVEALPHVSWMADSEGKITDFSQRWLDLTGLTREEALGEGWVVTPHPDDLPSMATAWSRSVSTGEPYDVEHRIRLATGGYRWMRSRATRIDDRPPIWLGSVEDIHDRKMAEAETQAALESLRLTQQSLSLALQGGRMGWWSRDLATDEVLWSPELEAIFGVAPGAFSGTRRRFLEFIHPEDLESFKAAVEKSLEAGTDYVAEFRFRRVDGTEGWMEGRGRAVYDELGRPTRSYGFGIDITRQREMQNEAERQLRITQAIADNADSPMALVDQNGQVTFANPAFFRVTGYTAEEIVGKTAHELVHYRYPDGRHYPIEECRINRAYAHRESLRNLEDTFFRKDGTAFPVIVHIARLRDDHGHNQGGVLEFRDVSHERAQERALRESESQYRQIAEAIPQIVWTTRPDGYHDFFNQRWYDYSGMERGGESGWQWKDYLHPHDLDRTSTLWNRCLESGEPYEIEYRFRGKDGAYRWFLGQALPIRDEVGTIARWFGTLTDIHDQKETQRALALVNEVTVKLAEDLDLERIVQALTDASTEAIGAEFGAFFYNVVGESGECFLLYTLSGAPISAFSSFGLPRATEIFGPTFRGEATIRSNDITKDPRYGHMPPHYGMPKGHLPVVSYLAVPVTSRSGECVGGLFFGHSEPSRFTRGHERLVASFAAQATVAMDNARLYAREKAINDELEENVKARTRDLQAANSALTAFTYHVSHDLRGPLRAIVSTSRIVQEDFSQSLPPEALGLLDRQAEAASKLGRLIDDLLRLSRLSHAELNTKSLDLTGMAREVSRESLDAHPHSRVRVEVAENMVAKADPHLLRLALGNLIENAVKYSPEGGSVRVGQRPYGTFFVTDEGIGIDRSYFEKIFEPFERLHRDEEFPGTGIGLSNVRQVIERHGGRVWVESEVGKGSTFLFTL